MRTTSDAGRHRVTRQRRRLTAPSTWIAAVSAMIAVAAIALGMAPAQAASTVGVQLTLSGVASSDNPTGGAIVGVHPGDSVVMHASAIPTAGAPAGLSDALAGLVAGVAGVQVKIMSGNLPGVHYPVTLGKIANCGGRDKLLLQSLAKGTYSFKYVVQKVSLLTSVLGSVTGCNKATVTPTQDQLGTLTKNNVKVTDNAVYSGSIVVATNPPSGQIGVQLPSQSVSAKVGPVHTSVNLPGATVGVPNPVPGITSALPKPPGLPGGNGGGSKGGSKGGSGNVNYTPPAVTVPEQVMPHAVNMGGSGRYVAPGAGNGAAIGGHIVAPPQQPTATVSPVAHPSDVANAAANKKPVDLSQGPTGTEVPVVLAILAILALSVVTAGYARMVLLKRH